MHSTGNRYFKRTKSTLEAHIYPDLQFFNSDVRIEGGGEEDNLKTDITEAINQQR